MYKVKSGLVSYLRLYLNIIKLKGIGGGPTFFFTKNNIGSYMKS